ncbi:MAG TPA: cupredoxin domain-containing protein [Thermomicrobiales bacterium]|jgi:uncharacterized cupredoxin-like copper-binding protein
MKPSLPTRWLVPVAVVALTGFVAFGASPGAAQQADTTPHPDHIHQGSCAQLDPNPQYPLNNVTQRMNGDSTPSPSDFVGAQSAIPVETSSTEIDVKLDDLLSSPHALNVHESAQNIPHYIACGDLGGYVISDTLVIGLFPQNNSGFSGVAILQRDGDKTRVDVYLIQSGGAQAGGAATPAAAGSPAATTGGGQAATSPTVNLEDIKFDPNELTIPANTAVTVNLVNKGASIHNFNIDQLNVHSGDIQPGQTGSVTINAPAGDYQYYCAVPGHKEAGMVGTLHVQ